MVGGSVIGRVGGAGGGERMRFLRTRILDARSCFRERGPRGRESFRLPAKEGTHKSRSTCFWFIQVAGSIRINPKGHNVHKESKRANPKKPSSPFWAITELVLEVRFIITPPNNNHTHCHPCVSTRDRDKYLGPSGTLKAPLAFG